MFNLPELVRRYGIILSILLLSVAVLIGQICDAGGFNLDNVSDTLRLIIDQSQYLVGLMIVSFLFIIITIRKYEEVPNNLIRSLKWYFILLFFNDFFNLLTRMIQKSNIVTLQNGFSSVGAFYLILVSVRSVVELLLTSAAAGVLAWGLIKYRNIQQEPSTAFKKLGPAIIALIIFKVVVAIPVCLTGILTDRQLYIWSLFLSQIAQLTIAFLFYWVVKEHQQQFKTRFFSYLTRYFGISLAIAGLNFIYTMGSYSILQRYPAGELETLGGFGKVVLFISMGAQIVLNYWMYCAITGFEEVADTPAPLKDGISAAVDQLQTAAEQTAVTEDDEVHVWDDKIKV